MANHLLLIIGWIGTVLVALVVGRFAASDPRWDSYLAGAGIGGVVCLCVYAVVRWQSRPTRVRTPTSSSPLSAATFGAGVVIASAVAFLAGTFAPRWDVSSGRVYQLSSETHNALRELDAPLRILLFVEPDDVPAYRDLLDEYAASSARVSIEAVDAEAQAALVRQYDVQEYGTSVIEYKGRYELVRGLSEQGFTNAVMRLREGRTRKIYFSSGHAERDVDSTERVGYSNIVATLRRDNFVVETINFTQQTAVPADAALLVVAGPRADFFSAEIGPLREYVRRGGAMLVLVDPFEDLKRYITESGLALFMMDPSSVSGTGELRNLIAFLREQGADVGNDVVVDTGEMGQFIGTDASVPVASRYPSHPITDGLTSLSAYPMARSVKPAQVQDRTATAIIETGDRTWTETDIQQLGSGQLSMDQEEGDRPGPVSLGVAIVGQPGGQSRQPRLVVVGDSDFAANYSGNIPGNAEMFLSMIRWLAQDKMVTIPSRLPERRLLTMSAGQERLLSLFVLLMLPGIAVAAALHLRKAR